MVPAPTTRFGKRGFMTTEKPRGPGRPEKGRPEHVRFAADMRDAIDAFAVDEGVTRAEAIRRLVQRGLDTTNQQTGQPE